MRVDVVLLPKLLEPRHLAGRAVVVLDVLRATTTIAAALAAGAQHVRVFGAIEDARAAAPLSPEPVLLAGESRCLRPEGFDLGNSPAEFTPQRCAGKTILLSTTNGTRALLAARGAALILAGALVNTAATARHLPKTGLDVTLLCAGTGGEVAAEDVLGAGAVLAEMDRLTLTKLESDAGLIALTMFNEHQTDLPAALRRTLGGRNVIAAGLGADINFAARLNVINIAAVVDPNELAITGLREAFDDPAART
jgi:2-phosphosulfolactate phosphatase